jgi:pimeloyl-ACP methyl ester carboxylesterase
MSSFTLDTPHGLISVTDTGLKNSAPALLLIHGNASSSKVWQHILASPHITASNRVIAFDLPGHGASSNAPNPTDTYTLRGYSDVAVHILEHLCIDSVVVLGWSLGGAIAVEMVPALKSASERQSKIVALRGLMLVGVPPCRGAAEFQAAMKWPDDSPMGVAQWTEELARAVVGMTTTGGRDALFEDWMVVDALRADGRARMVLFQAVFEGKGVDQRGVVESEDVPCAVVNGGNEPYVNLNYLEGIKWKRLWRGECLRLGEKGHAPFWEDPAEFEGLLGSFLQECGRDGGELRSE